MIAAPVDGVVATQIVKPGQAVQEGQPLLTVLPGDGMLEAELLVPQSRRWIHRARRSRACCATRPIHGRSSATSRGASPASATAPLGPGELGALPDNAGNGQPFYRVTVRLARQAITAYGKAETLKPGMLLDADILGETRRLAEWLFEPLYSLQGKFGSSLNCRTGACVIQPPRRADMRELNSVETRNVSGAIYQQEPWSSGGGTRRNPLYVYWDADKSLQDAQRPPSPSSAS